MNHRLKKALAISAIALASALGTIGLSEFRYFHLLNLKAQDVHFVLYFALRGPRPVKNIVIIGIDEKTLETFPEPTLFWHKYYADAITASAGAGAKAFVLDVTFDIPVANYEKDNGGRDAYLAGAFGNALATMPVICAFVPEAMGAQKEAQFAVPLNMMAGAMGLAAYANLTDDEDGFVRTQELIESPQKDAPRNNGDQGEPLARSYGVAGG